MKTAYDIFLSVWCTALQKGWVLQPISGQKNSYVAFLSHKNLNNLQKHTIIDLSGMNVHLPENFLEDALYMEESSNMLFDNWSNARTNGWFLQRLSNHKYCLLMPYGNAERKITKKWIEFDIGGVTISIPDKIKDILAQNN